MLYSVAPHLATSVEKGGAVPPLVRDAILNIYSFSEGKSRALYRTVLGKGHYIEQLPLCEGLDQFSLVRDTSSISIIIR